ncbi:MAG: hypothetical protein LKK13_02860 [Bacilli bacterium]|nr:hypothetical protein [Bacilli bacterium]
MKKVKVLFYSMVGALCATAVLGASLEKGQDLRVADATVSTAYMRVWITSDPSNPLNKDGGLPGLWFHTDSSGGEDVHVTAHDASGYGEWDNGQESNRPYYYFDVPTATVLGSYMSIQRFSPTWGFWNQSDSIQFTEDVAKSQQVFYLWGDWKGISQGVVPSVDAGMAAHALEGLLTCSDSVYNGYGAFAHINNTFIKDGSGNWKTIGNLSDHTIYDYASVSDYGDPSKKTTQVNAYAKYLALSAMAS